MHARNVVSYHTSSEPLTKHTSPNPLPSPSLPTTKMKVQKWVGNAPIVNGLLQTGKRALSPGWRGISGWDRGVGAL